MIGQHDAAGTDANALRATGHMPDQDSGGGAGNSRHAVVFGEPEALVAQALGLLRQRKRVAKRLRGITAFDDGGQVEDGQRSHDGQAYSASAPLTAALSFAPGVKRTAVDAGMSIAAPVLGLRLVRAARLLALKLPKPVMVT